jgi:NAD(P)-dependent dehydrogenase (short-subunit alcohol dehydrogenase family)
LAVARALLREGGQVTITGRDPSRLDSAVATLAADVSSKDRIAAAVVDVRDRPAVDRLVADVERRCGGLDALINNAGVGVFEEVGAMSDADWSLVIDTNLTGVFYCTRAAIPAIKRVGGGWIVNVASLAGRNYFPRGAAYCASKAGLIAFSEALMQEVRYDNIRVTVVMPGSVATEFSGHSVTTDDDWKLSAEDVALAIVDVMRHPARSLASKVEIRPSKPKKG